MSHGDDHIISMVYALESKMEEVTFHREEFFDKWSRWHDKLCRDGKPSSNNGWIYSAYADLVGLPVNRTKLYECFSQSRPNYPHTWPLHRSPGKALPPMSRDEILGLDYFNMLWTTELADVRYWQFCDLPGFKPKPLWRTNWIGAFYYLALMGIAQLIKLCWWNDDNVDEAPAWIRKWSHRNSLWEAPALWHLGFRLMPQDTWYMLKRAGFDKRISWLHNKYAWYSMERTIKSGDPSGTLIVWMKLNRLNLTDHPLYKKIDIKKMIGEYFTYPGHPIAKKVLGE